MFKIGGSNNSKFTRYLFYNSINNFICGIETTLSTYSMMNASGLVNSNNIDVYTMLFNMTLKDMVGQFACIPAIPLIAKISKYGDLHPKRYLAINVFFVEASTILEYITPIVPSSLFIPFAGIANIGKTVGLTGGSAFSVAMINHMSKNGKNIMEMSSKITAISTVTFSLGSVVGLGVIKFIPCYYTRLVLLLPMGYLRFLCSKKAVKGLI